MTGVVEVPLDVDTDVRVPGLDVPGFTLGSTVLGSALGCGVERNLPTSNINIGKLPCMALENSL